MGFSEELNNDDSLKQKVVKHYRSGTASMREIAKIYGISSGTVSKWSSQFTNMKCEDSSESVRSSEELESENIRLREENQVLRSLFLKKIGYDSDIFSEEL